MHRTCVSSVGRRVNVGASLTGNSNVTFTGEVQTSAIPVRVVYMEATMTTHIDNYETTLAGLREYLFQNAPAGLREQDKAQLTNASGRDYFSLEFRRDGEDARSEATLYIRVERPSYDREEDSEGNMWAKYRINAQPSWPSWGSMDANIAQKRLALMTEVASFAVAVNAMFAYDIWQMIQSKTERDEFQKSQEARKLETKVQQLVMSMAERKNMRLNAERTIELPDGRFEGIPQGKYHVEADDGLKHFVLTIHLFNAFLHRTA
jgi:hypothetical protein